ncbi:MAG TPA: hypothetical protein VFZ31_05375 [Vicinamibacterales bacterium]
MEDKARIHDSCEGDVIDHELLARRTFPNSFNVERDGLGKLPADIRAIAKYSAVVFGADFADRGKSRPPYPRRNLSTSNNVLDDYQ